MVVPDGTMQKGKRLGAEGVGEGVYGPPRGLEGWMGGWEGVGLAGVRCCSRDQRQGKGARVWRWQRAAVRQIKAKSPVLAVSETGRPCEMRFEHRAERAR